MSIFRRIKGELRRFADPAVVDALRLVGASAILMVLDWQLALAEIEALLGRSLIDQ